MRQIDITWVQLGITVTAELTDDKNPRLADLLWDYLPYRSLQNHALVSGQHLYHLAPIPELVYTQATMKENRTQSPDGTLFLSRLQHLAIKYGPLTEYLPAAAVGHVLPKHLPLLREAGEQLWQVHWSNKQPVEVRITRTGENITDFPLPRPLPVGQPQVQRLIDNIHIETERAWTAVPPELAELHEGRIASQAGSYDQYFSTMVFVNGETRPLGYCALNGLVEVCQGTDISLAALRAITPTFIKVPAEFLGYCGLGTLWDFTRRALDLLDVLHSKEEYLSMIGALALYANCLNTWNLLLFPWQHGTQHPHPLVTRTGPAGDSRLGVPELHPRESARRPDRSGLGKPAPTGS